MKKTTHRPVSDERRREEVRLNTVVPVPVSLTVPQGHFQRWRMMSMRNRTSRNALAIAVIGLALLAFSGALLAQQLTGNIFGNVTDEQGGRLPGVTVTLSGIGAPKTETTDARGEYRFLNLSPGNYTLSYELQGFSRVTKSDVQVAVGKNTETSAALKLSSVEANVTVRGEAAILDPRKVTTGAVVSQVELKEI